MAAAFPTHGTNWQTLKAQMTAMAEADVDWRKGRNGMNVFYAGADVLQVAKEAYTLFMSENGLNLTAFPSLKQMERTILSYGLDLLNAPQGARGSMTSGGTESIVLALKTAREKARAEGRDTAGAEIVMPRSAHPSFEKGCAMLGLEPVRVDVDPETLLADPAAMDRAIGPRTLMLVASAPAFPSGCIDPIGALGKVAARHNLWFHVDACVGGYLIPFVAMNGEKLPVFDFRVPAVTSISADLHKYGWCAKGASTVFYRTAEDWAHQRFDFDVWPAGRMITPTMAGTRPGGAIAAAYAVMTYLGEAGYRAKAAAVTATRERFEAHLRARDLTVFGKPQLGIISFGTDAYDIWAVWKRMMERGWTPGLTSEPRSIHMMLTPAHAQAVEAFFEDFDACAAVVRERNEVYDGPFARYS